MSAAAWFEFRKGRFYHRLWFIHGDAKDVLAGLWFDEDKPEELHFVYRFRYYGADPDPWADDRKSGCEFILKPGPEAVAKVDHTMHTLNEGLAAAGFGNVPDEMTTLKVETSDPEMLGKALMACPFASARVMGPDA